MSAADSIRLDRWLWAARFFKTRRLAVDAIKAGKVSVDGVRAKPARAVKTGQRLDIRKGVVTFSVDVEALSDQRAGGVGRPAAADPPTRTPQPSSAGGIQARRQSVTTQSGVSTPAV
jgi:ribosome-associated heat shock protein Hsp15